MAFYVWLFLNRFVSGTVSFGWFQQKVKWITVTWTGEAREVTWPQRRVSFVWE